MRRNVIPREDRGCVVVCVTNQNTCRRLIGQGAIIAKRYDCALSVVHVTGPKMNYLGNPDNASALELLYGAATEAGAELAVLKSSDVAEALAKQALKLKAHTMIMGAPPEYSENIIAQAVEDKLPHLKVIVIGA